MIHNEVIIKTHDILFMGKYNEDNFHNSTFAEFKVAYMPQREPDFISPSGSKY